MDRSRWTRAPMRKSCARSVQEVQNRNRWRHGRILPRIGPIGGFLMRILHRFAWFLLPGSSQAQSKPFDPALFAYSASGSLYAAAVFPDGTIVGDPTKTPGTRAASPGDQVSLYGTGFGTSPSGVVIDSPTVLSNPVVVTVGGQPATVEWAGLVGVGLFQINIVVPNLPVGDFPVAIQFQGASAASPPDIPIR